MGLPHNPREPAPAYDDVWQDHPVNASQPSGPTSAYATIPQEDIELASPSHHPGHTCSSPAPDRLSNCNPGSAPQESQQQHQQSLTQTIAGVFRPKPHVHCKECDVQMAARERRANEKHCCSMVAATFMTAFVCVLVLGIVVVGVRYGRKRGGEE